MPFCYSVIPGNGLENGAESSLNFLSSSTQDNNNSENKVSKSFDHKEVQTVEFSVIEVTVPRTEDITIQSNKLSSALKQGSNFVLIYISLYQFYI